MDTAFRQASGVRPIGWEFIALGAIMKSKTRSEVIASMSVDERIEIAVEKSKRLAELLHELERAHANNRYLTYTPNVLGDQIANSMASNAFASMRTASFGYELVRLSALWDKPAKDRTSVPEIVMLIDDPAVKAELKARIELHYPDLHWLRQRAEARFDRDYKLATALPHQVIKSHRLISLRNWRDKWLAHNLDIQFQGPRYGYERKMRKVSHKIADALTRVIEQTSFDYENTIQMCQRHADQLWSNIRWDQPEIPRR
jgi:response regulator RpfG family c-di-GMP phosphodiesterase